MASTVTWCASPTPIRNASPTRARSRPPRSQRNASSTTASVHATDEVYCSLVTA